MAPSMIRLDVGSGMMTRPGWVGIDNRAHQAVQIIHDLKQFPWPLETESVHQAYVGAMFARVSRDDWGLFKFMNELHRILLPGAEMLVVTYYGINARYLADPAACNPVTEATFYHFDPLHKSQLWFRYQPDPWRILNMAWDCEGNLEALLAKPY